MPASSRRVFIRNAAGGLAIGLIPTAAWSITGVGKTVAAEPELVARFLAAIRDGELETVRELLTQHPVLAESHDAAGRSGFALAHLEDHDAIGTLLIEAGYRPDVHEAALAGDWERFGSLAKADRVALHADHALGGTAMYAAARGGVGSDIWRVYADLGNPNAVPLAASGASPLQVALRYRELQQAEMTASTLLSNDADPNPACRRDDPPLHIAAERGSYELVEMLIRLGADVVAVNGSGRTALQLANASNHERVASLLKNHAAISRTHSTSRSAYDADGKPYRSANLNDISLVSRNNMVSASHGRLEEVTTRLGEEPRLAHSVATTSERSVEAAAHMGRHDLVDLLLQNGAPYSLPTAVMNNDIGRVTELLDEDALRIHERGAHHYALLWYPIIGRTDQAMLELLLKRGARVEEQHKLGTTALHYACQGGPLEWVELLIRHGADVNRSGRTFSGARVTPLQFAEATEQHEIVALLKANGAEA